MDQMARGFVMGATAGRTTLSGEGLQHDDGQSILLAATNPGAEIYDPAYGYEIGHIFHDGLRRMYGEAPESVFYYMTVYNEPSLQPAEPKNLDVEGLLKGMYLLAKAPEVRPLKAQILASGVSVPWALKAQKVLAEQWGVAADVWSVTSWVKLHREGVEAERLALLNPTESKQVPYVAEKLANTTGPVIAVSDWMRAVPQLIAPYVPQGLTALGTDGWGLSDTRGALRRHFLIDAEAITVQTLACLATRGEIDSDVVAKAFNEYQLDDPTAAEVGSTAGDS
jgi:pyruvate dehydrogenase E1 component